MRKILRFPQTKAIKKLISYYQAISMQTAHCITLNRHKLSLELPPHPHKAIYPPHFLKIADLNYPTGNMKDFII